MYFNRPYHKGMGSLSPLSASNRESLTMPPHPEKYFSIGIAKHIRIC